MKIKEWIINLLEKRLNKKKYNVIQLQWRKAELEKQLQELKRLKAEGVKNELPEVQ